MVKSSVIDTGSKMMQVGRSSIKRLIFTSVLFLSIFVAATITVYAQQIEGMKSRPQKPPDIIHEKHPKRTQPIWIIEREYQEPPTIIIRVEDSTKKEKKEQDETPAEPQATGPLIIEKRGDTYERSDNKPPVPKDTPQATKESTPKKPTTQRACPTCTQRK